MEAAAARKERLKALKAAQQLVEGDAGATAVAQQEAAAVEPEKPVLKFRNYTVKDEQHIQHEKVCMQLLPSSQHVAVKLSGLSSTTAPPSPATVVCALLLCHLLSGCNDRSVCLSLPLCRWRQRSRQS